MEAEQIKTVPEQVVAQMAQVPELVQIAAAVVLVQEQVVDPAHQAAVQAAELAQVVVQAPEPDLAQPAVEVEQALAQPVAELVRAPVQQVAELVQELAPALAQQALADKQG